MEASPLAKLSPELRNNIYELCCRHDEVIISNTQTQPAITQVCRQMRREALLLSYSLPQVFVIDMPVTKWYEPLVFPTKWFHVRAKECIEQIRAIKIRSPAAAFEYSFRNTWYMFCKTMLDAGLTTNLVTIEYDIEDARVHRQYELDLTTCSQRIWETLAIKLKLVERERRRSGLVKDIGTLFAARRSA